MGEERDAFYVVRRGDIIGVYKNLNDCQLQSGPSVCNPSISVYKGYGLTKEALNHLASNGLMNASYTISANDFKYDLFGKLVACPYQEPCSSRVNAADKDSSHKRSLGGVESEASVTFPPASSSSSAFYDDKDFKSESQPISSSSLSCILEFDGASKGNPGLAGAGAVLRAEDGSIVCCLREGVGVATNNVAEYRGVLLGLKHALKEGFKHIRVQGDSKLVCMQVQGLWKTKNQNMAELCKQAKELKEKFISFQIDHVMRELNTEADAQANRAVNLRDGQVEVDRKKK
ncbi:uncharacterized protein LOC107415392 isoform X4 [Ziziphus jujuba]|uniref:Uncharacterized protein LOC107415392 isoform X4 n=1 Tax=Ziziphus jujuba TaxID=326968 RepID=A0ABM3IFS4_ZIZJJ|nr:uncharacterized protein LOC107415392 isoform X4 [Ziziphus jujuba]